MYLYNKQYVKNILILHFPFKEVFHKMIDRKLPEGFHTSENYWFSLKSKTSGAV